VRLTLSSLPPDSRPRAAPRYGAGGRIVGARAHIGRAYADWKDAAAAYVRGALDGRPPLSGPVEVRLLVVVRPPLRLQPAAGATRSWCARKPDVDNVAKGVLDALTDGGAWADDAQVCALVVHRCWAAVQPRCRGEEPVVEAEHIEVVLMPADGQPGRW